MKEILKNTLTIKHLWGGIIPLEMLGVWAIFQLVTGSAPDWWWIATFIGYVLTMMIGVGAGNHRLFSHRAFTTSKFAKRFILFCGVISAQGSPILWAGVHRGGHHRYSDVDKDPHSPKDGFWHSYVLWMFKINEGDVNIRAIADLLKDDDIVFVHKHYSILLWAIYGITALISLNLFFYLLVLPAFLTLQVFCIQTSLVHYKSLGYRNYNTGDDSVNSLWLFPLTQGEAWHNNHHGDSRNPNFGGRHWWELDPTYWIIKLIRTKEK